MSGCYETSEAHNTLLVHLHSSISGNCVKSHSDRGLGGIFFSILPNPKPGSYKWFDESKNKKKNRGRQNGTDIVVVLSGMIFIFHQASCGGRFAINDQQNTKATYIQHVINKNKWKHGMWRKYAAGRWGLDWGVCRLKSSPPCQYSQLYLYRA